MNKYTAEEVENAVAALVDRRMPKTADMLRSYAALLRTKEPVSVEEGVTEGMIFAAFVALPSDKFRPGNRVRVTKLEGGQ